MDDIDDFLDDDFDAALISEIDAIEQRHVAATQAVKSQTPVPEPVTPAQPPNSSQWIKVPPTKRSKTDFRSAQNVRPPPRPPSGRDSSGEPPDISITVDGSYAVAPNHARRFSPATSNTSGSQSKAGPSRSNGFLAQSSQKVFPATSAASSSTRNRHTAAQNHVQHRHSTSDLNNANIRSRSPTPANDTFGGDGLSFAHSQIPRDRARPLPSASLQGENLEGLKTQLLTLQRETELLRKNLRQVEDEKLMKEGEVNNVRRNMEKEKESHAKALERIKKENEEAIKKAAKASGDLQTQLDALQTQLEFKKQEELSRTKFSGASRSAARSGQSHMVPNQTPLGRARTSRTTPWTPRGSPVKSPLPQRPTTPVSATLVQPRPQFSSFQNSFNKESSPVKKRDIKGKGKEVVFSPSSAINVDNGSPMNSQPQIFDDLPEEEIRQGNHTPRERILYEDLEMDEPMWQIDRRNELHVIVFNHSYPFGGRDSTSEPQLTLQVLLSTSLSSIEHQTKLSQACTNIIGAFGTHTVGYSWLDLLEHITGSFLDCALVFHTTKEFLLLSALLDLFASIVFSMPDSAAAFLRHAPRSVAAQGPPIPTLVTILCSIIQTECIPPPPPVKEPRTRPPGWENTKSDVVRAVLDLIEALCQVVEEMDARKLHSIPKLFLDLVDAGQPIWVIDRALSILPMISSHPILIRTLMDADELDPVRSPILQKLSALLNSPVRWATPPEYWSIVRRVVTFWASTIDTYDEAVPMLIEAPGVIPSLMVRLQWLSGLLWEETDDIVEASEDEHLLLLNTICSALQLLWFLVRPERPRVSLLHKIQQVAGRDHYNGLHHIFMVGIGRLSYSEPPDWLPEVARDTLVEVAAFGRDVLELVVEGPEVDGVWVALGDAVESDEVDENTAHRQTTEAEEELAQQMDLDTDLP